MPGAEEFCLEMADAVDHTGLLSLEMFLSQGLCTGQSSAGKALPDFFRVLLFLGLCLDVTFPFRVSVFEFAHPTTTHIKYHYHRLLHFLPGCILLVVIITI